MPRRTPHRPGPDVVTAATPSVGNGRSPLSSAQERLWFLQQLTPTDVVYNVPLTYRLHGPLDAKLLDLAIRFVVGRHQVLHTRFEAASGTPEQVRRDPTEFAVDQLDLSADPEPVSAARRVARADAAKPFDLGVGPLLRSTLITLAEDDHVLLVTAHHTVFDGESIDVFQRDLGQAYQHLLAGEAPRLDPLPMQYAEYAVRQRTATDTAQFREHLDYWKGQLDGFPMDLGLPADRSRPAVPSHRSGTIDVEIDPEVSQALRFFARKRGVSLFAAVLAVYQAALARHALTTDIVVGIPLTDRTRRELEPLIGHFINSVPIRADLPGTLTFADAVTRVWDTLLDGIAFGDVPFERIVDHLAVDRDLSRNPVFQVWMELRAARTNLRLGDTEGTPFEPHRETTTFDLDLQLRDGGEGRITGWLIYAADLFDAETAERFTTHLLCLLEQAVARPDTPLSALDLTDARERAQQRAWNATTTPHPHAHESLIAWFEYQARTTPNVLALQHGATTVTYRQLNACANEVAHQLIALGARPDDPIALCLRCGPDQITALLAILKTGAPYLPVDPDYPPARISHMITHARVTLALTDPDTTSCVAPYLPAGHTVTVTHPSGIGDPGDPVRTTHPDQLAYVFYTSGSTGTPKAVAMTQRGAVNHITGQTRRSQVAGPTLQFSTISFDFSFREIFATLLAGGTLVLIGEDERTDPDRVLQVMTEAGVRRLFCLPRAFEQIALAATRHIRLPPLGEVTCAGEQLHLTEDIRAFVERLGQVTFYNHYGPTETPRSTVWCLPADLRDAPTPAPIGGPPPNIQVYVLGGDLREVPAGAVGEIFIGGAGVARGYLGQPARTAERFVPDPHAAFAGARLYRTGDLARRRVDGTLLFLGRTDHQIKVRGFRIEPAEIETALLNHPAVAEAIVVPVTHRGDRRIAAYVGTGLAGAPTPGELHTYLKTVLPPYLVPPYVVVLPLLPRSPVGKIDHAALPDPASIRLTDETISPLSGQYEQTVARVWSEVLGRTQIGADDDFFALGGHSLLAMRITVQVEAAFRISLPLRTIFDCRTVRSYAAAVAARSPAPQR
jgi:amino acid adenylation domain-containing protein